MCVYIYWCNSLVNNIHKFLLLQIIMVSESFFYWSSFYAINEHALSYAHVAVQGHHLVQPPSFKIPNRRSWSRHPCQYSCLPRVQPLVRRSTPRISISVQSVCNKLVVCASCLITRLPGSDPIQSPYSISKPILCCRSSKVSPMSPCWGGSLCRSISSSSSYIAETRYTSQIPLSSAVVPPRLKPCLTSMFAIRYFCRVDVFFKPIKKRGKKETNILRKGSNIYGRRKRKASI